MKSSTQIVLGVNNVGDASDAPQFFEGSFTDSILFLAKFLGPRSMASRFDIVLARTVDEAKESLARRRTKSNTTTDSLVEDDDILASLKLMMGDDES